MAAGTPTQLDHYRLLGRSGLRVSPLSLGAMTFGGASGWQSSPDDAVAMMDRYLDRGGNFIDTANYYGQQGGSELALAGMIAGRRHRVVLATKYSLSMEPGDPNASGNHRKNMMRSVEDSLRRLGTDYIDLLYLHVWDSRTPIDEIARAFDDLVRQGKVHYAGLSDTPAWQASRMQMMADLRGWAPFVALQIPYSLIERTVERELMPMALETGMGVIPWSPLGGGVLTGKYTKSDVRAGDPADRTSRRALNQATGRITERNLGIAQLVGELAAGTGHTAGQVALAWTLRNPAVVSPIVGARTLAQFDENLGALAVELDDAQLARLDEASRVPMGFPHDMLSSPVQKITFGNVTVEAR